MSDLGAILGGVMTDQDRAVLDLAGRTYVREGAREQAAHDELGMTATRYFQRLNVLLDDPVA